MIRALFVLVMVAVGVASYGVAHRLSASPRQEKIVYCPLGTTDPECVQARRMYDSGRITTPSNTP
jgi:hypothetical protein